MPRITLSNSASALQLVERTSLLVADVNLGKFLDTVTQRRRHKAYSREIRQIQSNKFLRYGALGSRTFAAPVVPL